MKRIVILTGSELRHSFLRIFLAANEGIHVVQSFCEGLEKSLESSLEKDELASMRRKHVDARKQSEEDFFRNFVNATSDQSNPCFIKKGAINSLDNVQKIIEHSPDLLIAYGCSIVEQPLLRAFSGRFLNVHLGLSPYYRGTGTNFWPLVNGEPQFVGATFMHIDAGIDTGEIVHQIRARMYWGDTPSSIGNRLISEMASAYKQIILGFDELKRMPQLPVPENARLYKRKDFTEEAVVKLYEQFDRGMVDQFIENERELIKTAPIIENLAIKRKIL